MPLSRVDLPRLCEVLRDFVRILENPTASNPLAVRIGQWHIDGCTLKGQMDAKDCGPPFLIQAGIDHVLHALMPSGVHTNSDCADILDSTLDEKDKLTLIECRDQLLALFAASNLAKDRVYRLRMRHSIEDAVSKLVPVAVGRHSRPIDPEDSKPDSSELRGGEGSTTSRYLLATNTLRHVADACEQLVDAWERWTSDSSASAKEALKDGWKQVMNVTGEGFLEALRLQGETDPILFRSATRYSANRLNDGWGPENGGVNPAVCLREHGKELRFRAQELARETGDLWQGSEQLQENGAGRVELSRPKGKDGAPTPRYRFVLTTTGYEIEYGEEKDKLGGVDGYDIIYKLLMKQGETISLSVLLCREATPGDPCSVQDAIDYLHEAMEGMEDCRRVIGDPNATEYEKNVAQTKLDSLRQVVRESTRNGKPIDLNAKQKRSDRTNVWKKLQLIFEKLTAAGLDEMRKHLERSIDFYGGIHSGFSYRPETPIPWQLAD